MAYVNNLLICTPLQAWFTLNMHQIVMWGDMFMDLLGILPCLNPKTFIFYVFLSSLYFYTVCSETEWKCFVKAETIFVSVGMTMGHWLAWSVILAIGRCPSTLHNQCDKIINCPHLTLAIRYWWTKTMSSCAVWDWHTPNTQVQMTKMC